MALLEAADVIDDLILQPLFDIQDCCGSCVVFMLTIPTDSPFPPQTVSFLF